MTKGSVKYFDHNVFLSYAHVGDIQTSKRLQETYRTPRVKLKNFDEDA